LGATIDANVNTKRKEFARTSFHRSPDGAENATPEPNNESAMPTIGQPTANITDQFKTRLTIEQMNKPKTTIGIQNATRIGMKWRFRRHRSQ
jgi:hypothetical protein